MASGFVEAFLLEQGGGAQSLAWGQLPASGADSSDGLIGLYKLMQGHIWYREVVDRAPPIIAHSHSNMLVHIL